MKGRAQKEIDRAARERALDQYLAAAYIEAKRNHESNDDAPPDFDPESAKTIINRLREYS